MSDPAAARTRRDLAWTAAAAVVAYAWLALLALPALRAAGDPGGLPTAAWVLPLVAVGVPWAVGARTRRTRGAQAALGALGCVAAAGVMEVSPIAGVVVALAGVALAALVQD